MKSRRYTQPELPPSCLFQTGITTTKIFPKLIIPLKEIFFEEINNIIHNVPNGKKEYGIVINYMRLNAVKIS